jgi:hypothetical protein
MYASPVGALGRWPYLTSYPLGLAMAAIGATVYRSERSGRADIIDLLTMYPDARRRVVRVLSEIEASSGD